MSVIKEFEPVEFHESVTFFGTTIVNTVGSFEIAGDLTITGGDLTLSDGDIIIPATDKLYLDGGGNTYIFEQGADDIAIVLGGTVNVQFLGLQTYFGSTGAMPSIINNTSATSTVPAFLPNGSDVNTGIGRAAADQLSLIAGGVEGVRVGVDGILFPNSINPNSRVTYSMFEDFNMKALNETDWNWILNSGGDDLAVDPAIVIAENETVFLDAGDGDGAIANDGSQIVWAIPVTADKGGLVFEVRLAIEDIELCSVNIGLTEASTLTEPFEVGGGDTVTSNATDAVCFVFDDGADTKEWFCLGVAGDTEATGNGEAGDAPVNGIFQVLRCEVDADGGGATFYIDGVLVGTLTANVVTAATALYFMCVINGDGANAVAAGLTVDYMYLAHTR